MCGVCVCVLSSVTLSVNMGSSLTKDLTFIVFTRSCHYQCAVSRSLSHDAPGIPWVGISRACAHIFSCHVFHAGTHFTNTRPVKFRQPLSLTYSIDAAAAKWSVLSMCGGFTAGQCLKLYSSGV